MGGLGCGSLGCGGLGCGSLGCGSLGCVLVPEFQGLGNPKLGVKALLKNVNLQNGDVIQMLKSVNSKP